MIEGLYCNKMTAKDSVKHSVSGHFVQASARGISAVSLLPDHWTTEGSRDGSEKVVVDLV